MECPVLGFPTHLLVGTISPGDTAVHMQPRVWCLGAQVGQSGHGDGISGASLVGFRLAHMELSGVEFAQPVSQCCV